MMLVVRRDIPAGDAIIFKVSYLFKVRPPVVNFVDPGPNVTQCRPYMFNQTDCMHKNILTNATLDNLRGCPCIPADCFTALCNSTNYTALVTTNTRIQNCSRTVVNGTTSFMPCNISFSCRNLSFCPVPRFNTTELTPPIPKNASIASIQLFDTDQLLAYRLLMGIEIEFTAEPRMKIQMGEKLVVRLPGFNGLQSQCLKPLPLGGKLSAASWSNSSKELMLTATAEMTRGSVASTRIPWYFGIRVPDAGLTPNQTALTVSTDAAEGAVLPTVIASPFWPARTNVTQQNVTLNYTNSTFLNASVAFSPPIAGFATNLSFMLRMNKALENFESITVYLPYFTGANVVGIGTVFGPSG
jgi:hypothetical protein